MLGGVLQIVGLLALLVGGCEFVIRLQRRRAHRAAVERRLAEIGGAPEGGIAAGVTPWGAVVDPVRALRARGEL